MANVMEIIIRAIDQASGVLNEIGKTGSQTSKSLEQGFKNAGKVMTDTGKTLSKNVTLPLVGVGTAALATVANFDDSMSKVSAISGATGKDLERLRDMAQEMGSTTRYSASEAADAMSYLALAGWDVNEILGATPGMLDLAAAAGMDLARAADIVSDTMSAFGMDAQEAGKAADIFAAASSKSNTSVDQLGEAMKYASANANAAGMDLAQTAAVMGVLADSGIKGSQAGTTFNAMLRDLRNSAEDGKIAIGDLNVEIYDQQGNMRDLGSILADVEKATQGMTAAQRDAALAQIFGEEAMRGVNIMLATGSERYKELESTLYSSEGAAQDMAATMENNLAGAMRQLKSQAEGILIQLGEQLVPIIMNNVIPAVQKLGDMISGLLEWFNGLSEGTKNTIITILGLVAAAGPLLIIFGKMTGLVGSAIKGFQMLHGAFTAVTGAVKIFNATLLANPIGLVIAGIVALIAVIVALWQNWDQVSQFLSASWEWIKELATTVFGGIAEFLSGIWNSIKEVIISVWTSITETLSSIWEGIKNLATTVFESIANFFTTIWNSIKSTFETALNAIQSVVSSVYNKIKEITSVIWNGIKNILSTVINSIKSVVNTGFNWISSKISGVWEGVKNTTKRIWDSMVNIVKAPINSIIGLMNGMIGALNSVVIPIPKIPDWIPGIGGMGGDSIGFNIPKIPLLARGGFIKAGNPTPAIIGEGRYDEAVIPLSDAVLNKLADAITSRIGNGGTGEEIVITVPIYLDSREIARATTSHISTNLARKQTARDRAKGRG